MPTLEITTMIGCPLKCTFCPQDNLLAAYGKTLGRYKVSTETELLLVTSYGARNAASGSHDKYLSLETFSAILNKVPRHVRIDFAGFSEPWANPQATDMLQLALEQGYQVTIYATLFGMTLSDADRTLTLLSEFITRLEILCLHLPDANQNMTGWRVSEDYLRILEKFLEFGNAKLSGRCTREGDSIIVPTFQVMTMDGSGKVHPALAGLGLTLHSWQGHTRAGGLTKDRAQELGAIRAPSHQGGVVCSITPFFDHNVLLPNGDVVLCCMDYSLKHILGNLLEQDYYDLFASREMAGLRFENSKPGFSKFSLCKSCNEAIEYKLAGNYWMLVRTEPSET